MKILPGNERNSNSSFTNNRTSPRLSTVTIDVETAIPPPVYFTTTINDPPMPIRRDSSYSQYFQKNLNSSLQEGINNFNSEGNWSLLDNLSLYEKIFKNSIFIDSNVNKNDQERLAVVVEGEEEQQEEKVKTSEQVEKKDSWISETFSSSPILSRFSFFESNKSNSPSSPDNNKKKVRFITQSSNSSIRNDESQFVSTSNSETLSNDTYINNGLYENRKRLLKSHNFKLRTFREFWEMPWKDKETKKFTKKFWLMISILICLTFSLTIIGVCLYVTLHP